MLMWYGAMSLLQFKIEVDLYNDEWDQENYYFAGVFISTASVRLMATMQQLKEVYDVTNSQESGIISIE